jgi:serine/threonine protein kinase
MVENLGNLTGADHGESGGSLTGETALPFPGGEDKGSPQIPGYRIVRQIERGGQGVVYEAVQETTSMNVAIKVLKPHAPPEAKRTILAEIRVLAHAPHPNVVRIFDAGETPDGRVYFVMELVRGRKLDDFVRERKPSLAKTLALFHSLCEALHHMHTKGVVHRDVKPKNILVDAQGTVKLVDFGLAKLLALPDEALDKAGVGTRPFMSPEQTRGIPDEIDARTDIYSLGVTLYFVLTGELPYTPSLDPDEMFMRIRTCLPVPPRKAWNPALGIEPVPAKGTKAVCPIDRRLERIVLRMLAKNPHERYENGGAAALDLDHFLKEEPLEAPLRHPIDDGLILGYRKLARKHPLIHAACVIVASCVLTGLLAVPLIYSRTLGIDSAFERMLFHLFAAPADPDEMLSTVRIIALPAGEEIQQLAPKVGIESISGERVHLRALHGRLMKKLVKSNCRTVVWDGRFGGETSDDADVVAGIRSLNAKGCDVIAHGEPGWLEGTEQPPVSQSIRDEVKLGMAYGSCNDRGQFVLNLTAARGLMDPLPSIALMAFASYRPKSDVFDLHLETDHSVVHVMYDDGESVEVPLSFVESVERKHPELIPRGYRPEDTLGMFLVHPIPSKHDFDKATIPYRDVLLAKETKVLRQWFADKVVIIGDIRAEGEDNVTCNGGPSLPGCYLIAAGTDALIRNRHIMYPRFAGERYVAIAGATAGFLCGWVLLGRTRWRVVSLLICTGVILLVSLIVFWKHQYVINPLFPASAAWIASELTAGLQRGCRGGPEPAY